MTYFNENSTRTTSTLLPITTSNIQQVTKEEEIGIQRWENGSLWRKWDVWSSKKRCGWYNWENEESNWVKGMEKMKTEDMRKKHAEGKKLRQGDEERIYSKLSMSTHFFYCKLMNSTLNANNNYLHWQFVDKVWSQISCCRLVNEIIINHLQKKIRPENIRHLTHLNDRRQLLSLISSSLQALQQLVSFINCMKTNKKSFPFLDNFFLKYSVQSNLCFKLKVIFVSNWTN